MKTLFIALLSILLSVAAQFSLKTGMSSVAIKTALAQSFTIRTALIVFSDKNILGGFLLYGLGAIVWLWVLSKWDVSKAYPLVGMGFVLTVVIGFIVGEQITSARVLGVILICAGVLVIGKS